MAPTNDATFGGDAAGHEVIEILAERRPGDVELDVALPLVSDPSSSASLSGPIEPSPKTSSVTPWRITPCDRPSSISDVSEWLSMLMKPGATARPVASTSWRPRAEASRRGRRSGRLESPRPRRRRRIRCRRTPCRAGSRGRTGAPACIPHRRSTGAAQRGGSSLGHRARHAAGVHHRRRVDVEGVRQPDEQVEQRPDIDRLGDLRIAPTGVAQALHLLVGDAIGVRVNVPTNSSRSRSAGETGARSRSPSRRAWRHRAELLALQLQEPRVAAQSIVTVVQRRHVRGDHLVLGPRECAVGEVHRATPP